MYQRIVRLPDAETLAQVVAERLVSEIVNRQQTQPMVNLCLTGGRIANQMYREFAELASQSELDVKRLQLWWGDERYVGLSDSERNSQQALAILAGRMQLSSANTHLMPAATSKDDPGEAALVYANELGDVKFDICLLGMGEDGHVASIFPNHPSFDATSAKVIGVSDAPKPPPERISLTLNTLNRSEQIWLLVSGKAKADAFRRVMDGDETLPATHVQAQEGTLWFVDESVAAHLPPSYQCQL